MIKNSVKAIFIASIFITLLVSSINVTASSESDDTRDLWHWYQTGSEWKLTESNEYRPNIDIISLDYSLAGNQLTLIMNLAGPIDYNPFAMYQIFYGNIEGTYYTLQHATFTDWEFSSTVWGPGLGPELGYLENIVSPDGKTISANFEIGESIPNPEIWGVAYEYVTDATIYAEVDPVYSEFWMDIAPLSIADIVLGQRFGSYYDQGNEDVTEDVTPPLPGPGDDEDSANDAIGMMSPKTINDETNDVFYGSGTKWATATNNPNIDITQVTFNDDGETVTITISVKGVIENSENVMYWASYVVGDQGGLSYSFSYNDGKVAGIATTDSKISVESTPSVSGNTLTVEFESFGKVSGEVNLYAHAQRWNENYDLSGESWWDYAPGSSSPWYDEYEYSASSKAASSGGSPGFEVLPLIIAIGVAYFLLRKKR